jgi:GAF domain-containing protein
MPEGGELAESLAGVAQLPAQELGLEDALVRVAQFAVRAIPSAEAAGLTLLRSGRSSTVVATAGFVGEVDEIQYALGEGPCVSAMAERRTFVSGNLGGEARWPRFGPRVGRLGVHSALSLPLLLPDRVVGAMNVYAHERDAFAERALAVGEAFAFHAAASVAVVDRLAEAERVIGQLRQALTSRAEIDQAIGVVMGRTGLGAPDALDRLKALSQARSMKVAAVARELLTEAVQRTGPTAESG